MVSDFEEHLGFPADGDAPAPRLVAFLGSTIGNLLPDQRAAFLARVRAGLRPGDFFLLGTDLVKDPATLVAAYDDDSGVTAAFNKNVLAVLNTELGADFDPDEFEHVAVWDAEAEWIEMRLRSLTDQTVHLPAIGLTVRFAAGEEMRTEVSAKFRRPGSKPSWPRPAWRCAHGGPTPPRSSACRCPSRPDGPFASLCSRVAVNSLFIRVPPSRPRSRFSARTAARAGTHRGKKWVCGRSRRCPSRMMSTFSL